MQRSAVVGAVVALLGVPAAAQEPVIFAEGAISTGEYESHPAFTPDGRTLYFCKSTPDFSFWTIVVSRLEDGKWTQPETAPFSGQYADADPFITADGEQLYFISNRPGPTAVEANLDIWVMDQTGDGWSEPRNLGAPINSPANEWFPTLTTDGTIYFGSERPGGRGRCDIYSARLVNGRYETAENLGEAINTQFSEFEPLISPDESYLIFAAVGRPDGKGQFDLFVSYRRDGVWTKAVNLGEKVNTPATEFSPARSADGKRLMFTSTRGFADKPLPKRLAYPEFSNRINEPRNGLGDIYEIDLSALNLESRRML
jgi:Tol biopolymer transport system component